MNFNDYLATFASVEGLSGLNVVNEHHQVVHHIPAIAGKLGSLKLFNALAMAFEGNLNATAAAQGLIWFAEHTADAIAHPGKHPNVDLLMQVQSHQHQWRLEPLTA